MAHSAPSLAASQGGWLSQRPLRPCAPCLEPSELPADLCRSVSRCDTASGSMQHRLRVRADGRRGHVWARGRCSAATRRSAGRRSWSGRRPSGRRERRVDAPASMRQQRGVVWRACALVIPVQFPASAHEFLQCDLLNLCTGTPTRLHCSRSTANYTLGCAAAQVLKRRRTNSWQKDMSDRRALVKKYNSDPAYKKQVRGARPSPRVCSVPAHCRARIPGAGTGSGPLRGSGGGSPAPVSCPRLHRCGGRLAGRSWHLQAHSACAEVRPGCDSCAPGAQRCAQRKLCPAKAGHSGTGAPGMPACRSALAPAGAEARRSGAQVDDDKRARAQAERKADPPVSLFDIILVTARTPGPRPCLPATWCRESRLATLSALSVRVCIVLAARQ